MRIDDFTKQQIHDAQQGDSRAFEYLYNTFYKEVYSIARYILKSDSKAEDILQETFIKVYHKLPELKNAEAFSSWLYMITQNECRMVMRKKDENLLYMDIQDEEYALLADVDPIIPFGHFEKEDDRLFVKKEVEKLPIHHRMVIVYYYYLNMPVKEIAKLLSCNENTIKSRLFAGRTLLKKGIAKIQEQLGTPLVFAVLPLTQIAGNNILEQSISKNAAKAIYLSISGSVGAGIGQVGIFWRLRNFLKRSAKKMAGVSALLAVLLLMLGVSGVVAATAILSDMFSLNRNRSELNSSQAAEPAYDSASSNSEATQNSVIATAENTSNEPTSISTPVVSETIAADKQDAQTAAGILVSEKPSATRPGTAESVPLQEPAPSPVPTVTTAPTPTNASTPTTVPTPIAIPTQALTASPTSSPTAAPTQAPTAVPSPTPEPTVPATPTAGEIASAITSITSPATGDISLTLPICPAGYSIAVKSSGDESVIALDGTVTPSEKQQTVAIVLIITKEADHTTAETVSIGVVVPRRLSDSTELLLSSDIGTKLAGVVVKEDTSISHREGTSESDQTLLIVTISSANISSAELLAVSDYATVTAVTATNDSVAGGVKSGDYVPVQTNTFDFTSNKFLWIKVVSEDLTTTRYYSLYVLS